MAIYEIQLRRVCTDWAYVEAHNEAHAREIFSTIQEHDTVAVASDAQEWDDETITAVIETTNLDTAGGDCLDENMEKYQEIISEDGASV